eukprot:5547578-Pyramimonas_sp.AAC.1
MSGVRRANPAFAHQSATAKARVHWSPQSSMATVASWATHNSPRASRRARALHAACPSEVRNPICHRSGFTLVPKPT